MRSTTFLLCLATLTFATLTAKADDQPKLEILPKSSVITKAIGLSLALTCKPNVQNPSLITQLEWRDPKNRKIDTNTDSSSPYVQQLTSEPGAVLIFTKLTEDQAGDYTCSAKYANTEAIEATIKVDTIIDITWVDAPESQFPVLGKDYRIRCEVQAKPAPIVEWVRNKVAIISSDRYVTDNKGLLIKNVRESDDGLYTCRAVVVSTGNVKERNIKVEVQVPPQLNELKEISIIEGEQASVQCSGSGKPPPEYTWIKEKTRENLATTDRFDVKKNTGLLIINKVEYNDNSVYKCIAENQAGRAETTVKINVLIKPKIFEFINITSPIDTETKIICKAFGRPTPRVSFRKLSLKDAYTIGPQKEDKRIVVEQSNDPAKGETYGILSISRVNRTDDGLYECIAENEVDAAYKNGHITVEFPPTFEKTKHYPPVWTWDNRPGNLSCIAESIPNATIIWRLGGVEIQNSPNMKIINNGPQSNLIVSAYSEKKFFTKYECIAKNRLGDATHFIELKQAVVPGNIQQVTRADLTATTVKFNIVGPPVLHGLPLRAIIVQYQTERERIWDTAMNRTWSIDAPYIVENLVPQETYTFRFAAKNDVGIGHFGAQELITMPRRSVPAEPKILVSNLHENSTRDFVANSPYADHFELRWNVPSDNGDPIDSYLIKYCVSHRVNGEWRDSTAECSTEITQSFEYTHYELNQLSADTTYKIELRAHNAIGTSSPAEIRVKTARGLDTAISNHEGPAISSAMIIGIVVGAVLLILIVVDITCFCVNRAGIIAMLCYRSKSVDEEDPKLGSYKAAPIHPNSLNLPMPVKLAPSDVEEKEPLNTNQNSTQPINYEKRNISVEFDGKQVHTKPVEIGRHSAV
ncbi:PREDICTED: fasciclin-2 isoform X2 [Nicrophorus vespilloides]|uniref:Fasciclin-2 isoform X2 n=1 Tax=Nicrophorus vespilloides TaxID=110193 RepID=A0ABM1N6E7_NICVS|nr:PREDICTED: fasciclin-2 isoform X2 [Nicrophorus vespilloides]